MQILSYKKWIDCKKNIPKQSSVFGDIKKDMNSNARAVQLNSFVSYCQFQDIWNAV